LLSLNLLQFLACLQENFLLSAVLLPAMASAADAPATFTPEQEAQIGKIAADCLGGRAGLLLSLNLLQFLACLQENFRVGDQVIGARPPRRC
jgi:hypothetical protein